MRKDIFDFPATNEKPALQYFGVFQPSSDKTRLIKHPILSYQFVHIANGWKFGPQGLLLQLIRHQPYRRIDLCREVMGRKS